MGVINNSDETEAVADAKVEAVTEPAAAIEGVAAGDEGTAAAEAEQPRDERRDSIDPATGLLTAEALAIRAAERAAGDAP